MKKLLWCLLLPFLMLTLNGCGDPIEKGVALYKQKKYEEAVKYLQDGVSNDKADTPGNTFALYILGDSYYYGIGVEKENRS